MNLCVCVLFFKLAYLFYHGDRLHGNKLTSNTLAGSVAGSRYGKDPDTSTIASSRIPYLLQLLARVNSPPSVVRSKERHKQSTWNWLEALSHSPPAHLQKAQCTFNMMTNGD